MTTMHISTKISLLSITCMSVASAVTHSVNHDITYWPISGNEGVELGLPTTNSFTYSIGPGDGTGYDAQFNDGTVTIYWDMLVTPTGSLNVTGNGFGNFTSSDSGATFSFAAAPSLIVADGYNVISDNLTITFSDVLLAGHTGGSTADFTIGSTTTSHTSASNDWIDREIVSINETSFSTAFNSGWYNIGGLGATITGTVELEAVPEPTSGALLGIAGLALIAQRKRAPVE